MKLLSELCREATMRGRSIRCYNRLIDRLLRFSMWKVAVCLAAMVTVLAMGGMIRCQAADGGGGEVAARVNGAQGGPENGGGVARDSEMAGAANGPGANAERMMLLPEGLRITNREARLVRHPKDNRWFLSFVPIGLDGSGISAVGGQGAEPEQTVPDARGDDPLSRPMEILPNKWLTTMLKFSGENHDWSVSFRVSGKVTAYQDRNYIMLSQVAAEHLFGRREAEPEDKSAVRSGPLAANGTGANQTTAQGGEGAAPPPQKLRQALMNLPRIRPLAMANEQANTGDRKGGQSNPNQASASEGIWKDGHTIVDRVGRLAFDPDDDRWLFAFEADSMSLAEPPVTLLPCQLLEKMEKETQRSGRPIKFRVSGEITRYQRQNYMLLRKVLLVYDQGNLGG